MIKKKLAVAISAALSLGAAGMAQAAVYTSTADNFTGNFVISGFADANPGSFQISLTNVQGALDLYVPKSGTASGQRIGNVSLDISPAPGAELNSVVPNWTALGNATFDTSGITGNNFNYNFSKGTFTSDGVAQSGGSFSGSANALDLILGNMFGTLGANIGTGSVSVTHTLAANTWTLNVTETPVGVTGFAGLFTALDSKKFGGNSDGVINGSFSVNASVAITTNDGVPTPGGNVEVPVLPSAPAPGTPEGTFVFDNIPVGNQVNEAGQIIGLNPLAPLWIDPVVAVGYRYELGANSTTKFATITAPSLGTVNDANGYEVWLFNGTQWTLAGNVAAGGLFTFPAGGVTAFEIRGINPDLGLDPTNDLAFPLGVTLTSAGSIDLTMTALTVDTGTAVPEPTSMALIGLGLAAMAGVARRKKA